jgi:hypothetical protein
LIVTSATDGCQCLESEEMDEGRIFLSIFSPFIRLPTELGENDESSIGGQPQFQKTDHSNLIFKRSFSGATT